MRLRTVLASTVFAGFASGCAVFQPIVNSIQSLGAASVADVETVDVAPVGALDDRAAPRFYELELHIDPRQERFSGTARIDVTLNRDLDTLWIHGRDLAVETATYTPEGGAPITLAYEDVLESGVARLSFPETVEAGDGSLNFVYDAPFNTNLAGLYAVEVDGVDYAVSQMQDIDARRAFPSFDEPRFKTPFSVAITARTGDVVVTNGPLTSSEPADEDHTRHVFAPTRPLPTYLTAFAVGPYGVADIGPIPPNAVRADPVPLRGIARASEIEKMDYALRNTGPILEVMEEYFDIPHPYAKIDLIAAPDYAFGAMENAGAIVYLERLLILDEDSSLNAKRFYALVHAHELAHQWFGNLVTPNWWTDIWLNESFATWFGNKAAAEWAPQGNYDRETLRDALGAMQADSLATARRIREPITRNEDIINAFDAITYQKGGGVLAMFESYLGEEAFRDGVRLHMARFEDGVADAEDFMTSLADGSGNPDVTPAFKSFVEQPGVPLISAQLSCAGDTPQVTVSQSPYRPLGSAIPDDRSWIVPVCVSYASSDAEGGRTQSCTLLAEPTATFALNADACPTSIVPNAQGAGYYRFALDAEGWRALLADFNALPPKEAIVVEDSLRAGFDAGAVDATTLMAGLETIAQAAAWDVATAPEDALRRYVERVITDPDVAAAVRAKIVDVYRPRFGGLDASLDDEGELLAAQLIDILSDVGRDADLRADLLARGQAYLAGDSDAALPRYAVVDALTVVAQDGGADGVEAVLAHTRAARDPLSRRAGVSALGQIEDPAEARRVRDIMLADDAFPGSELGSVLFGHMAAPAVQGDAWAWFQSNADAMIAAFPTAWLAGAPGVTGAFCSADKLEEIETVFTSYGDKLPGYELSLTQTLETISLCAQLRAAKADEFAAFAAQAQP